jgi:superfamily II DNA or RNA helicase
VVSERIAHLRGLKEMIQAAFVESDIIIGETPEKRREEIVNRFNHNRFPVLLVTSKIVPNLDVKGFDFLFVTCPFKYTDHITQMVGKLLDNSKTDRRGVIFEYHDRPHILQTSLDRRLKVYRMMGASC